MTFILSTLIALNTALSTPRISIETENINDILKAEVKIENVEEGLLGAAFHLEYDPKKLKYIKHESGNFFEQSAKPIYLIKQKENNIIFGETLKKGDELAKGEGEIVNFYFKPISSEKTELKFKNTVLSSYKEKRIDINGNWESKDLQANITENNPSSLLTIGSLVSLFIISILLSICGIQKLRRSSRANRPY